MLTRKDYMGAFEICFYGWREGAGHNFYGPNNAHDLWHIKKVNPQSMIHLTEKPVELAVRAIQYSSKAGENVLDLFGGSGSTLIACEQTDRKAFLMEIDPLYCDVIVQRWEKFAGRKAECVSAAGSSDSEKGKTERSAAGNVKHPGVCGRGACGGLSVRCLQRFRTKRPRATFLKRLASPLSRISHRIAA